MEFGQEFGCPAQELTDAPVLSQQLAQRKHYPAAQISACLLSPGEVQKIALHSKAEGGKLEGKVFPGFCPGQSRDWGCNSSSCLCSTSLLRMRAKDVNKSMGNFIKEGKIEFSSFEE